MMHLSTVVVNMMFVLRELFSSAIFLLFACLCYQWASPVAQVVKNTPASARDVRDVGLSSWVGKTPWRRAQPHLSTPAWRTPWTEELGGYSPLGHKELDTTEVT